MNTFSDLQIGQHAEREYTFSEEVVTRFADLVGDHAPVHIDEEFARARSFSGRIVHGFFAASIFSGLLGEKLPGPQSVINTVSLRYHLPVLIGHPVTYRVLIKQLSPAVRVAVLDLEAQLSSGQKCISGVAHCSFR